jgi:serine/threonine-protein kinase
MREGALRPGTVIGGFTIRRLIGQGGMGEVYAADAPNGERAALKVLHERAAQDPDLVARFNREAEIAKTINSPYVARVLGVGKDRDGRLWIAFELLVGEGLDERLKRETFLPFSDVCPIVGDALRGLHAAHAARVVHRDIKPANLFIEKRRLSSEEAARGELEERTRILDFGVSKLRNSQTRAEPSLTAFDATLGSFAYMAPEQVRGSARVDERADLYALGAVAFRALSGRLPFEGTNALTLIALKLDRDPPTLASITGDDWPQSAEQWLAKIMARDREKRFSGALEALDAWEKVCKMMGNLPAQRVSIVPPEHPEPDDRTEVTVADGGDDQGSRSRRR